MHNNYVVNSSGPVKFHMDKYRCEPPPLRFCFGSISIFAVLGDSQFGLRRGSQLQADMSQCLGEVEVRWPLAVTSRVRLAANGEQMFQQRAGSCSCCSPSSPRPSSLLVN